MTMELDKEKLGTPLQEFPNNGETYWGVDDDGMTILKLTWGEDPLVDAKLYREGRAFRTLQDTRYFLGFRGPDVTE